MEQRDNKLEWSLIYELVKNPNGPQVIFCSPLRLLTPALFKHTYWQRRMETLPGGSGGVA